MQISLKFHNGRMNLEGNLSSHDESAACAHGRKTQVKRRAAQKQAAPKNEFHQDQSGFLYTIAEAL
jgi:hypothetical protein